ncbi:hypothetical protein DNI29_17350 [Hymenobacter sediminis]|uniref:hypothetical protein n=1 Tax=Hymenobacter sediminis TaxID=2218621 RepID=UPI000F4E34FA|nr:hypothetical protein [Hymenobacter sediminis]RPD45912.1 hypothetical protein DNI29_17350 [Hymenobacter sediminis]
MKLLPRLLVATLPLLAAGCAGRPTQPAYDLVITHANVVNVETGRVYTAAPDAVRRQALQVELELAS